jgi:hypothetical protein
MKGSLTNNNNSVFIGGGVPSISYLWLLPIIDGYCKKNNIKTLIFESCLPKTITEQKIISKILKKYYLIFPLKKNLKLHLIFIFFFIKNFIFFFFLVFFKKKNLLNKKNSNVKTHLYHSMWDTSFQSRGHFLYPNLICRSISAIKIIYKLHISNILIKLNIHTAFIIHSVYHHRMLISKLLDNKINIFIENGFSYLIKCKKLSNNYNLVEKEYLNRFSMDFFKKKIIEKYWNLRIKGKGGRKETYIPSCKKIDAYKDYNCNVIMLPVLKDSQFLNIDKNRVFADCVDWLKYTINIINHSKEKWIIKFHPSMREWGEDTKKILELIISKKFLNYNNIKYVADISNNEVFLNAKRIITFNGTSQIESGCFGKKPIVISRTDYNYFNSKLVLIPKTLSEYKKLLLMPSDSDIFKLNKEDSLISKFFIFFKENVISFYKEVGKFTELRNSPKKIKKKNFNLVLNNIKKNYKYLFYMGSLLNHDLNVTASKKYIKYLIKNNL